MPHQRDIPVYPHTRTGIWHLRRTIPTSLRKFYRQDNGTPRKELSPISLRTKDRKEAVRAAAPHWTAHLAKLDALQRGRAHAGEAKRFFHETFEKEDVLPDLAGAQRRAAEIVELNETIELYELELRINASDLVAANNLKTACLRKRDLLRNSEQLRATLRDCITDLEMNEPEIINSVLDEYVDALQIAKPQPLDSPVRTELREIAREEALKAQRRILELLGGSPSSRAFKRVTQTAAANATDQTPQLTVQEYYKEVFLTGRGLKNRRGEVGISPSGMEKSMEAARDFTGMMGQVPLAAVTPTMVRDFHKLLLRVPVGWRKRNEHIGKPLRKLIEEADNSIEPARRLSPETVNSTLSGLSAMFAYAVKNEHVNTNPAAGIRAEEAKDKERQPAFEIEDLKSLFASPWFAGSVSDFDLRTPGDHLIRDHRFWAFPCMLFSGARVSEIGGIHSKQVHITSGSDGFFEFDWTTGDDARRLKNASSIRVVPFHPELVRMGFIDYVKAIQAGGHERLFPGWVPQRRVADDGLDRNEYSSAAFLKRFKTYLVWLGIKRPGLSVKSFRSTWETATLGTDLNERSLLRITGRSQGSSLESYLPMKGRAEQLKLVVDRVMYSGLDLSHLYGRGG